MTHEEFKEIFDRDHKKMVYFATRFVGKLLAEDFVADAFAAVWEKKDIKDPTPFMYKCIKNACLNHIEHLKYVKLHEKRMIREADISENYIESKLIKSELISRVIAEIEKLPVDRRKIVKMYCQGIEPQKIAEMLKISVNSVRVQYNRFINGFGKEKMKTGRKPIMLTYKGETKSITEWESCLHIAQHIIWHRYRQNLPIEIILRK